MQIKFLYLLVLLPILPLWSQTIPPLDDPTKNGIKTLNISSNDVQFQNGRYNLTDYLYILIDSSEQLSFTETSAPRYADYYVPLSDISTKDLSMNEYVYWIRLSIQSDLTQETTWLTNFMESEVVAFIKTKKGDIEQKRSGILVPGSEQYFNKQYAGLGVLPISLPVGSSQNYYWRLQVQPDFAETEHGLDLNYTLLTPTYLNNWFLIDGFVLAIFVGFFIAVGLYHLVMFFYNKKLNYLWFFFYCLTGTVALTVFSGYDIYFHLIQNPLVHYFPLYPVSFSIWILFFLVFSKSFLQMSKWTPSWEKFLWFLFGLAVVNVLWGYKIFWTNPSLSYKLVGFGSVLIMMVSILLLVIAYICIRKGYQPAKFYLLANASYLIGIILTALDKAFHIFPGIPHLNWVTIGAWIQLCLFAYGMALMFRQYELQRLLAQAEAGRLQEVNTVKSRLYANITHEFRTPLTVILGMTGNIRGYEQERNLIVRNGKKLLRLINQILDLSKLDSGAIKLEMHQSDIITYLNYLVESFFSMAKEKNIQLAFYSEMQELLMDFDEVKLQHIVYNLLSNALKFTEVGGKVFLHARKIESKEESQLQLIFQDNGLGISQEQLPYIFDRFYQGDGSSTRKGEGTGIGLALTKEYVELLGGQILVKSEIEKGTEFKVLLPIKNDTPLLAPGLLIEQYVNEKNDLKENQKKEGKENLLFKTSIFNDNERPILLIVEDNKDVAHYIESIVKENFQIETALNGELGFEKAVELIPDVIISDVMMPKMDGFALTKMLKEDERTSHIPIIILTAKAEDQDRITGLQTGADAFLTKPFNKEELLIRLEKLTKLRKAMHQYYATLNPLGLPQTSSSNPENVFLKKIGKIVEDNLSNSDFTVMRFCREAQLSQPQLYRKIIALTGKSPALFIRSIRLYKALELLKKSNLNISEIAWEVGFKDPNYFSRAFQKEFGRPPSEFRK